MTITNVISLDVGHVRVGVAISVPGVRLAKPFGFLKNDNTLHGNITELINEHNSSTIVVGLPRGMQGQDTEQTKFVLDFCDRLKQHIKIPIVLQDEALTSQKAEQELNARNKPYEKGDIDALAACYILQDYLETQPGVVNV